MSSSSFIDNKKKNILILGKGLEHTLAAEKMYSINFTKIKIQNFVQACIVMEQIVIY